MTLTRRAVLGAAAGLGLSGTALAASSCGRNSDATRLRLAWWGNQTRTKLTNQVITDFQATASGSTVLGEPGEWSAYWDKLATQTAANDAPDVIQMDLKYLREYGDRGALVPLDQVGLRTDDFGSDTLDPGRTGAGLMGVNAGVNALLVAANPTVFDQLGLDLPDDETWTWDEWADLSAEITARSGGEVIGSSDFTLYDLGIWMWLRQRGKDLYTADGLGFDADDVAEFFDHAVALERDKAIPPAGPAGEDIVAPLAERLFVQGKTAMSVYWSNQVQSLEQASGEDLVLLRFPSTTGNVRDAKLFYNVSMMWSVTARTKNRDAAIALVDYLVNSPRAAAVLQAERGMPANTLLRDAVTADLGASDRKAADYLTLIQPDLEPPPPAPPAGVGDISLPQTRHLQDLRFGRTDTALAAKAYVDELTSMMTR